MSAPTLHEATLTTVDLDPLAVELGERLRYHREQAGLTQHQLGSLIKKSTASLSKWENGIRPIPVDPVNIAGELDTVLKTKGELEDLARRIADKNRTSRRGNNRMPAQLPPAPPLLIGRSLSLSALTAALDPRRSHQGTPIAVLTGTPCVGKTATAVAWAHSQRCYDGVLYERLHAHTPGGDAEAARHLKKAAAPKQILKRLLTSLRPDLPLPDTTEGRRHELGRLLTGKRMLLVLDDAATAEQVRALIPGVASCGVLITSRHRLGGLNVRGHAMIHTLDPLVPSDATELLAVLLGSTPPTMTHYGASPTVAMASRWPSRLPRSTPTLTRTRSDGSPMTWAASTFSTAWRLLPKATPMLLSRLPTSSRGII